MAQPGRPSPARLQQRGERAAGPRPPAPFPSHPHRSRAPNTTSHCSIPPQAFSALLRLIPHHSLAGCPLEADTWPGSPGSERPGFIGDEVCPGRA